MKAVLTALHESGQEQDTCFVFTTDHPTAGKGSCRLGRIPLIFYWPGRIAAMPPQMQLLSEVDLAPTLLELAGCPVPADMARDGRSFWLLLGGGAEQRKPVCASRFGRGGGLARGWLVCGSRTGLHVLAFG